MRWELRTKDEAAETLAAQLLDSDNWGEIWASRVVSYVDFRQVTGDANSARRPRCAWFEALVGTAQAMRAYPPVPPHTLERIRGWLDHQVAPSLALVVKADGGDVSTVSALLVRGGERLNARHLAMLAGEKSGSEAD